MLRATAVYLFVGLYITLAAPPAMVWCLISGNTSLLHRLARFCVRAAGWMAGIRVTVHGRDRIADGIAYVFLSNHQGNLDGPVLLHSIPRDWAALIKKEMMSLPILSLVLRQAQFVPIARTDAKKAHAGIELGAQRLRNGKSFVAFPEGTRSRDGRLREFKKGVFIMAIKAQAPVIPVTIRNSTTVNPPGAYGMRPGRIEVVFHDAIETRGMSLEDRDRLVQLVRDAIASELHSEIAACQPA